MSHRSFVSGVTKIDMWVRTRFAGPDGRYSTPSRIALTSGNGPAIRKGPPGLTLPDTGA